MAASIIICDEADWSVSGNGDVKCSESTSPATVQLLSELNSSVDPSLTTSDYYEILGMCIVLMALAWGTRQLTILILNRS